MDQSQLDAIAKRLAEAKRLEAKRLDAEKGGERERFLGYPPRGADYDVDSELLRFFGWTHLPPHLREVSRPFGELAQRLLETVPPSRERTKALDRLLEAKDAAVRAAIPATPPKTEEG